MNSPGTQRVTQPKEPRPTTVPVVSISGRTFADSGRGYGAVMMRGLRRGDVALAVALLVNGQWEAWGPAAATNANIVGPRWVNAVGVAIAAAALLWRRTRPLMVVATVTAVISFLSLTFGASQGLALFLPLLAALYAVGRYGRTPARRVLGLVIGAAAVAIHDLNDPLVTEVDNILMTFWLILLAGWTVGDAFRRRHERALRDEASRATAAVAEERARIARELHDIIAHSLGLVTVQAVAALEALEVSPDRAQRPLLTIESTARQALTEVRRLVTMMREDNAPQQPFEVSLETLAALVRQSGLDLDLTVDGSLTDLSGGLQLTVYRIVQEAVTNASKHAPGAAIDATVAITDATIDVAVRNSRSPRGLAGQTSASSGYGLIGIRERVAVYGGDVHTEATAQGGFTLHATIPVPP